MKKIKFILAALAVFLMLPLGVFAEEEQDTISDDKKVVIYFFHGKGCPHCEEASEWFEEIEDEYGDMFKLSSYEVWYNKDNKALMDDVAKAKGDIVNGVPYIVVGDESWNGFDDEVGKEIVEKIKKDYEIDTEKRYDVMNSLSQVTNNTSDVLVLTIILVITGVIVGGIMAVRKKNTMQN